MALIEIDQSGKWESSQATVIGASVDGKPFGARLEHREKERISRVLGGFEQEKNRSKAKKTVRMFVYSVFLTIRPVLRDGDILMIDQEYFGQEDMIRDLLLHLIRTFSTVQMEAKNIQFGQVGKLSLAHKVAHQTFDGKRRPDMVLKFDDYFRLLDRTEEIRKKALKKRRG